MSRIELTELERQKLAKAGAEVRKPSGWQPIETAPKDGTLVLVYCKEGNCTSINGKIAAARYAYDYEAMSGISVSNWEYGEYDAPHTPSCKGGYIVTATHWMPLPEPPK
ncbi:MAG: DUF551 domain-containing protein [Methylocystaceae bacterium]|nr:DUF551 domain-containing protein [Methylocystaceae bacterium]